MESQHKARASGPRIEASTTSSYLRAASATDIDDTEETAFPPDAGSQAWGDYLEEIEGYEI